MVSLIQEQIESHFTQTKMTSLYLQKPDTPKQIHFQETGRKDQKNCQYFNRKKKREKRSWDQLTHFYLYKT